MKKLLLCFCVCACTGLLHPVKAEDSLITVQSNRFITDLLGKKEYVYPLFIGPGSFLRFTTGLLNERSQILVKTSNSLYVLLSGSGFLFELENPGADTLRFKRIDKTVNINYNQGAYVFHHGKDVYNFGGYGFWKNNGILRRYSPQSQEWDVEPLSKELFAQTAPISPVWYDPSQHKLYLPYQSMVNSGLKERSYIRGKVINESHVLDLQTLDWTHLGKTNQSFIEMLRVSSFKINTTKGLIILFNDELYLLNYPENTVYKLKDYSKAQAVIKLTSGNILAYYNNKYIYSYNIPEHKYDSIGVDLNKFESLEQPIYENSINPLLLLLALVLAITVIWAIKKYQKPKPKAATGHLDDQPVFKVSFSDVEKALLNMLKEKAKQKKTAVITEINYILGVRDKNTGLQKKVRSDTFNSINEKYRYSTKQTEPLIQSIRSEVDKRYFEYFISPGQVKELEKML